MGARKGERSFVFPLGALIRDENKEVIVGQVDA